VRHRLVHGGDERPRLPRLPAGSYGVTAWFDHNGNILMGGGPDAGDTVCCFDSPVDTSTSSLTVRTGGCIDL
jgi:hypothetical protein